MIVIISPVIIYEVNFLTQLTKSCCGAESRSSCDSFDTSMKSLPDLRSSTLSASMSLARSIPFGHRASQVKHEAQIHMVVEFRTSSF